jgi:hypothetical protein
MNRFPAILALFSTLILSACYPPTTSHPVGSTVAQKLDPALVGLWKGKSEAAEDRGVYLHFLPNLDGSLTAILVQDGTKPDADWYFVKLSQGRLGPNRYLNARLVLGDGKPDDGAPAGTMPLLYRIDAKGQMTLYLMDEKATKDAIKAGKIKGTVGQGDMGDATITADAATLDKFMQTPAALALFTKPLFTLRRME